MTNQISPWTYTNARFEALHRQRKHLPNHAVCPVCGLNGLRAEFTRSQKRPGSTFIKCYCCGLQNSFCTDINGVYHILGMSNFVENMPHEERKRWLQKLKDVGEQFLQEVEFKELSPLGTQIQRKIAISKSTNEIKYVACPTCSDPTAEIRKDKKGRIYISHQFCGNRWFTHTMHSSIHFVGLTSLLTDSILHNEFPKWNKQGKSIWLNWIRRPELEEKKEGSRGNEEERRTKSINS